MRQLSTVQTPPTTTAEPLPPSTEATLEPPRRKKRAGGVRVLGADPSSEHAGARWATTRPMTEGGPVLTPAQQFAEFQRIQANTKKIGSSVEKRYVPMELIRNPPGPEDVTLELLMASQTHLGHNKSLWNPANSRYIYGVRNGVHIISLETTAAHLRRAARVVEEVSYRGGLILFVGTRKNQMEIVAKAADLAGACHLFTRWTPGAITNRDKILANKRTKMINETDKTLPDFDKYNFSARPLVPDLVVCLNPLENYTMLYECGLASVPTIGVIDTDADPSWVTYTIPANDDRYVAGMRIGMFFFTYTYNSLRSVAVIGGVLGRAGQKGRKRRLADAAKGEVPWSTSAEVTEFMKSEVQDAMLRRKEVMGRLQEQLTGFDEEESALLNSRLNTKPAKVGHEEMLEMLSATAEEEVEAVASEAVREVEPEVTSEASKIVAEFENMVKDSESKTLKMVSDIEAMKVNASKSPENA